MIKNFLYGIALITVAFAFTSCEDTNKDNFKNDSDSGYVQFTSDQQISFVGGFHTMLEIPVDLHTNTNLAGLDVFYKIDKISQTDINSVIVNDPGFVRFEPGQISSTTKIEVKSDIPAEGFMFKITLTSANRNNISFLEDIEKVYLTKEVCLRPIVLATDYVGEVYTIELNADGSMKAPEYVSTITTSLVSTDQENVYTFGNGAWGSDFVPAVTGNPNYSVFTYAGELTINPDGTVVVNGNDSAIIGGQPTVYTSENNKGNFNPCAEEISYILEHELPIGDFLVKVVIRPAN